MKANAAGIQLILTYEGFRSCPYNDGRGIPTIGYGHTRGVTYHDPCISKARAYALFVQDLVPTEKAVEAWFKRYGIKPSSNAFSAFVSFAFNLGPGILAPSHDIGRHLQQRDLPAAISSMTEYYNPGTSVAAGLLRRRHAEQALALKADSKPSRNALMVARWKARLVRLRADVHRLGYWTPGRKALAKELEDDIKRHSE